MGKTLPGFKTVRVTVPDHPDFGTFDAEITEWGLSPYNGIRSRGWNEIKLKEVDWINLKWVTPNKKFVSAMEQAYNHLVKQIDSKYKDDIVRAGQIKREAWEALESVGLTSSLPEPQVRTSPTPRVRGECLFPACVVVAAVL